MEERAARYRSTGWMVAAVVAFVALAATLTAPVASADDQPDIYSFDWNEPVTGASTGTEIGGVAATDDRVYVVTHGQTGAGPNTVEQFDTFGLLDGSWTELYADNLAADPFICNEQVDLSNSVFYDIWSDPNGFGNLVLSDVLRGSIYRNLSQKIGDTGAACTGKIFGNSDPGPPAAVDKFFYSATRGPGSAYFALTVDTEGGSPEAKVVRYKGNGTEDGSWLIRDVDGNVLDPVSDARGLAASNVASEDFIYVYEIQSPGGRIHKYDEFGTKLASWSPNDPATATPGATQTSFMHTDACGKIYYPDSGAGVIHRFNQDGTLLQTIGSPDKLTKPSAVAVDPTGNVYVLNEDTKTVVRYEILGSMHCMFPHVDGGGGGPPDPPDEPEPPVEDPIEPEPFIDPPIIPKKAAIDVCDIQSNLNLTATVSREATKGDLLGRGIKVKASTSALSSGTLTLGMRDRDAKKLGIKNRDRNKLGSVTVQLSPKEQTVRLELSSKIRKKLARGLKRNRKVKTIRISATFNLKGKVLGRELKVENRSKLFRARIKGKRKKGKLKYLGSSRSEAKCGKRLLIDVRPSVTLTSLKTFVSRRGKAREGISVNLSCSEDCAGKLQLIARGEDAAALKLKRRGKTFKLVGSRKVSLKKGQTKDFSVKVTDSLASKRLARAFKRSERTPRTLKLKVLFTAKTSDGIHRRKSKTVSVRTR